MDRRTSDEQILVHAPTGADASAIRDVLGEAGMVPRVASSFGEFGLELRAGPGTVILDEEALDPSRLAEIQRILSEQPSWSDLPILLLATRDGRVGTDPAALREIRRLGNVSVLERPLSVTTLVTAVESALRARRRQYAAREHLEAQRDSIEQRDRFLAMLGHELRNPLAAAAMAAEALARGVRSQERQIAIIRRQTGQLARIVDDLLDVARVTSGRITLHREPLDLRDLAKRCVDATDAASRKLRHTVRLDTPDVPLPVSGDPVRLEQVVTNLLANAIKYTPPGGHIRLHLSRRDSSAELSVTDDGVGIPSDILPHVFELFRQGPDSLARSQGGLGIGLTVVKYLVELHGGTIVVRSGGPGQGAKFTVRLPLDASGARSADAPSPAAAPAPQRHRRVLVIEDEDDTRESLRTLLESLGHAVDDAPDGLTGLERALAHPPEVMLVDVGLPGVDGYELAQRVRAALGDRVKLVALTGYGQPEDRSRAFASGFDAHLTKPAAPDELAAVVGSGGPAHDRPAGGDAADSPGAQVLT